MSALVTDDNTETIAEFTHDGETYQLDDLRICRPRQAGMYVIYSAGHLVAEFELTAGTEHDPPPVEELVEMAKATLDDVANGG